MEDLVLCEPYKLVLHTMTIMREILILFYIKGMRNFGVIVVTFQRIIYTNFKWFQQYLTKKNTVKQMVLKQKV